MGKAPRKKQYMRIRGDSGHHRRILVSAAIFGLLAFVPVAAFRAAGDVRYAVILAVGSMFTFRVGLSYLLNHLLELGLLSVWIGMWADWFFRAIMNTIHFRKGKWMYKRVI